MSDGSALDRALKSIEQISLARVAGRLVRVNGILLESIGCALAVGQRCQIEESDGGLLDAQVVGFNRDVTFLMPFKTPAGLKAGARVFSAGEARRSYHRRRLAGPGDQRAWRTDRWQRPPGR